MTSLREAAQAALEIMDHLHRTGDTQVFDMYGREATEALRAALAEPVQEPAPSAWRYKDTARICDNSDKRMTAPPGWVPLYSAPPQRKPLTEEEILRIKPVSPDLVDFRSGVRCAERAHGIKDA